MRLVHDIWVWAFPCTELLARLRSTFAYPSVILPIHDLLNKMTQSLGTAFGNFLSHPSFCLSQTKTQVFVYFILGGMEFKAYRISSQGSTGMTIK